MIDKLELFFNFIIKITPIKAIAQQIRKILEK